MKEFACHSAALSIESAAVFDYKATVQHERTSNGGRSGEKLGSARSTCFIGAQTNKVISIPHEKQFLVLSVTLDNKRRTAIGTTKFLCCVYC